MDSSNATNQPVLIMVNGAAQSGTTMLDLMLGSADAAFSCGELHAKLWPFRKHHFVPRCGCGDPECPVWQPLLQVPQERIHGAIAESTHSQILVDSSKDLRWVLKSNQWARAQNMRVVNVLIWKNLQLLAFSYWKHGKSMEFSYQSFLAYHERFLSLRLPFVSVSYEELAADTKPTLQRLCQVMGVQYQENQEEFWRKEHHQMFGSPATGRQIGKGQGGVRPVTRYPAEFVRAYAAFQDKLGEDQRLVRVIDSIRQMDLHSIDMPGLAKSSGQYYSRSFWYPWHTLKRKFHARFPKAALPG